MILGRTSTAFFLEFLKQNKYVYSFRILGNVDVFFTIRNAIRAGFLAHSE